MKSLVIVESPAKAKTISKYLGPDYIVKSSFGHVRDLPKSKMGIDIKDNFAPQYIISRDKTKVIKELKDAAKKCSSILFATDEDREGEAISWHLAHILGIDENAAQRIVFHEITKDAILHALTSPRALDLRMVNAQQARRILDRLVGYELSPFLWRKVAKGLSAGRVQSVAVRLIVEREREITSFKPEEYWSIDGEFSPINNAIETFSAHIQTWQGKKLDKMDIGNQALANEIVATLRTAKFTIGSHESKLVKRNPPPPFTTSTLQQEANHRLGFSAKQTMRLAQQLYEGVELGSEGSVGLITYMRTDAINLSEKFLSDAKEKIIEDYGQEFSLTAPRTYKNKSKNAQEAHEAIRPTEAKRDPGSVKPFLDSNQYKLYELIWERAISTQMAAAEISATGIDIISDKNCNFRATGQIVKFPGFLKLYPDKTKENNLPEMEEGDELKCLNIIPEQHYTEPPARYSDATLVKVLEEHGIGRPSTYAPTIATIEDRGYVVRDEKKRLGPTDIAFLVNDLLVEHFPHIVDYAFTAEMEESLDQVARGEKEWQPIISDFYTPFKSNLEIKDKELSKKDLTEETTTEVCDKCSSPMVIKLGRYGKFLACSNYPECKNIKSIKKEGEDAKPEPELTDEKCAKCGAPMLKRMGRFGPFYGCSAYPKCKNIVNIEVSTNLACPKCHEGKIVEKRSKRGKMFYACNRYPDCDYALWNKPTGEFCATCKAPLVFGSKGTPVCSNKECAGAEQKESKVKAKKSS